MLAQGQSSSIKRGGLVTDVSSGLIFLTKQKKEERSKIKLMNWKIELRDSVECSFQLKKGAKHEQKAR